MVFYPSNRFTKHIMFGIILKSYLSSILWHTLHEDIIIQTRKVLLYPPQTLFVGGILFSRCPSVRVSVRPCVRASVRPSVTFCFLNNLKSHCWIFIKPCKHVHICKTNTLDKKVRTRGQFYLSYFPL